MAGHFGAGVETVPIHSSSDGSAAHRPNPDWKLVDPPTRWLEVLGGLWMAARGEAVPGKTYYLDRLPSGYALYERARPANPKVMDKHLYGHPKRKFFDSANRFFPHFKHLMDAGAPAACPCTICQAEGRGKPLPMSGIVVARGPGRPPGSVGGVSRGPGRPPGSSNVNAVASSIVPRGPGRPPKPLNASTVASNSVPRGPGRPPKTLNEAASAGAHRGPGRPPKSLSDATPVGPTDHEGTPDPYRRLINKLRAQERLNEPITEDQSMDWLSDRDLLPSHLITVQSQKSWIPRVGEVVLFVRTLRGKISFHNGRAYEIFDHTNPARTVVPEWEAGVVTQVPDNVPDLNDLAVDTNAMTSVNYTGFRVEPLPDPNDKNKALSKQYKYVPLHQIRPFVFHMEYLNGIAATLWHPSIKNALKIASSFSLLEKYRFSGTWPTATIHCQGIFIGYELICRNDVVRLRPLDQLSSVEDVLLVTGIRLVLTNLDKASDDDRDEGHPYNSTVHLTGRAFTSNKSRATASVSDPTPSSAVLSSSYETWYPLHDDKKIYQVPFSRVIGRLFEPAALKAWFANNSGSTSFTPARSQQDDLNLGYFGLRAARTFARTRDTRIRPGQAWFWGDSRGEALGLETFNGVELAAYDPTRHPQRWRRLIQVLEAATKEKTTPLVQRPQSRASPSTPSVVRQNVARTVDGNASGSATPHNHGADNDVIIDDALSDTSMEGPVMSLDEFRSDAGHSSAMKSQEPLAKRMKMAVVVPRRE